MEPTNGMPVVARKAAFLSPFLILLNWVYLFFFQSRVQSSFACVREGLKHRLSGHIVFWPLEMYEQEGEELYICNR